MHCWGRISRGKTQHAQIAGGFAALDLLSLCCRLLCYIFIETRRRKRVRDDAKDESVPIESPTHRWDKYNKKKKTNVIPRLHHVPTDISCARRGLYRRCEELKDITTILSLKYKCGFFCYCCWLLPLIILSFADWRLDPSIRFNLHSLVYSHILTPTFSIANRHDSSREFGTTEKTS